MYTAAPQEALPAEQFIEELCDFILALPPVEGVNPLAHVLMGELTIDGVREWMKDFWAFGVTAVQRIAGQLAHTAEDPRLREHRERRVAASARRGAGPPEANSSAAGGSFGRRSAATKSCEPRAAAKAS